MSSSGRHARGRRAGLPSAASRVHALGRHSGGGGAAGATHAPVIALLGPTNTGKTHRAIERMLAHRTGMIGLPLRLLAREVYDRVTARVGEAAVALVTGEEKRVPAHPRYWICTVEAMPPPADVVPGGVEFVAVDEVQLSAHRERGHVFTDRVLRARGTEETLLLGADTMRGLIGRLVPDVTIESRPRLSSLTGAGALSMSALPPRTAVVAFSATRVYELAERLRAKRGGAAVVLGALSPRARNAQVALYQSGEVDYMVATDAIGMGLNMDVDCVAFADVHKFDGRRVRALGDAELAQIAGRAGRNRNDGRFATLAPLSPLPGRTSRAIETHRFAPEERVFWRNPALDTSSLAALRASLRQRPESPHLRLAADAEDVRALDRLASDPVVTGRADHAERVALLWQVCQVPDFRSIKVDDHFGLLAALYGQLTEGDAGAAGRLRQDWVARHVRPLEDGDGDLETLLARMASIRTWTYVTHQAGWLDDPGHWQERTRAIEDKLSDALHARLVQRFVDAGARRARRVRRAAGSGAGASPQAARPLRHGKLDAKLDGKSDGQGAAPGPGPAAPASFADMLRAHLAATGGEGGVGWGQNQDQNQDHDQDNSLDILGEGGAGPRAGSPGELAANERWVDHLVDAAHARFALAPEGRIAAGGESLARLVRGHDLLHPDVVVIAERPLGAGARMRLGRRLVAWTRDLVAELLAPLHRASPGKLSAAARGVLYQLEQGLGTIPAASARAQLDGLGPADRTGLRACGVRVGRHVVFVPVLLAPAAVATRVALCNAYMPIPDVGAPPRLTAPEPSLVSLPVDPRVPEPAYAAIGFPAYGARAVRANQVDAIAARVFEGARDAELASRLGCTVAELPSVRAAFAAGGRLVRGAADARRSRHPA